MIPTTTTALGFLMLAVAPGYLTMYFWSRNKTWQGLPADLQLIVQTLVISAVIQVLLLPVTLLVLYPVRSQLELHPLRLATWFTLVVLVVPYVLGTISARVSDRLFPPGSSPPTGRWQRFAALLIQPVAEPSIWDWAVPGGRLNGRFVVIEFQDGRFVGGTFSLGSFALTSPQKQGIFLNEEWVIDADGNFIGPVPNSGGVLVTDMSAVRSVRVSLGQG
ncbi:MAG TPA: DUF6338 family protein [Candidatus Dormibacteraeota bacterium]